MGARAVGRVATWGVGVTALLLLAGFAAACGNGGGGHQPPPATTCSTPGKAPAALYIQNANPTTSIGSGGTLTAEFEFEVANYTTTDLNAWIHVPTLYAKFPVGNGSSYFDIQSAPQNATIAGSGWSNPISKQVTVTTALSFSSGSAYLSTANLAVMVMGGTTNLTLEFRWAWTENSSGTVTAGSWSTPSSTATTPNYPSIFVAAPYVRVNETSNTTAGGGSYFSLALWGNVGKATFRTAIETTTGKELRCSQEQNWFGGSCFVYSIPLSYNNGTALPSGKYLIHVHDSLGAIVASISITVTNASWSWWGHSGSVECQPPASHGCGGSGSGWGNGSGTGGGRHGHW
ncbi:MAG: hypothetical protein L3K00_01760 [Thermoplasmata archaeon]|nr:hypothetical protein [Thermoplasmata archaeon]